MTASTLLKFTCKDPMCRTVIPVTPSEPNVQCYDCGIKYDQTAFQDAEPFPDYDDVKQLSIRRFLASQILPKRGAESVKVNGLSNFYCKLLSPFLTKYGMDPATGQARLLTEMNKGEIFDCSLLKDRAFLIDPDQLSIVGFGKDVSGSTSYLSATLRIIMEANGREERLVPLYTDGDGHCLVHATSRALVGRELFWHPLRCCLKRHFEKNLNKYQELFKDFMEPEDWKAIIEESDPDFKPPEGELHGLRNVHIFGLANILKRPIILLDSLECMKKCADYSALFLPGFIPPEECRGKDNTSNKPICIAWSSFSHNHYIPLVGVQNRPLPVLPPALIPKVWGMPQSEFEKYIELDSNGNCVIGGSRTLTESYIQRLVKAMEVLFLEKKGVHPMLVADAKLYLYSEPAFLNLKVESLIETTRSAAERGCLYRCLYCKALCKIELKPFLFSPGGFIYNLLLEKYMNFNSDTSYKVVDNGLSCKYDPVKNELIPDMSTVLPNCTVCDSSNVRMVRPDGIIDVIGDGSYNNVASSVPNQENRSLMNRVFETKSSSSQESKSIMSKMLESETVNNQESKMPLNHIVKSETASNQQSKLSSCKSEIDPPTEGNTDMLFINFTWKGIDAQHSISYAEFNELGSSATDCVSTLAANIAAKHFPNDYQDVHLQMILSDKIYNQISKSSDDKLRSPVTFPIKEEKNEKKGWYQSSESSDDKLKLPVTFPIEKEKDEKTMGEVCESAIAAISDPQYVKVVTSSGQQGNLTLSKEGISYCQLQEWIASEFKIAVKNQKIKWGFPPKEFEVPMDINEQNLPLKHGDRLLVENNSLGISQQKNYLNTTTQNSPLDFQNFNDLAKVPPELLWTVMKHEPDLFQKGGSFFETAVDKLIICDKGHVTLPCLPTKRFSYNAATNSLELCVKLVGHFQVSGDIDDRIERAKRGEHVPGVKKCPLTTGSSKEAIVTRPFRKPITPSPEESLSLFRKGPGFSVLSQPSEKMDFT